jgi:hypothetical protein
LSYASILGIGGEIGVELETISVNKLTPLDYLMLAAYFNFIKQIFDTLSEAAKS